MPNIGLGKYPTTIFCGQGIPGNPRATAAPAKCLEKKKTWRHPRRTGVRRSIDPGRLPAWKIAVPMPLAQNAGLM